MFQTLGTGGEGPDGAPRPLLPVPAWLWYTCIGIALFLMIAAQNGGKTRECAVLSAVVLAISLCWAMARWNTSRRIS